MIGNLNSYLMHSVSFLGPVIFPPLLMLMFTTADEKYPTKAEMFTESISVMFCCLVTFTDFCHHSLTLLEVMATGDQMRVTVMSKITDFFRFERCCKEDDVSTQLYKTM